MLTIPNTVNYANTGQGVIGYLSVFLEKHLDSVADHKLNMKHPWDAFFFFTTKAMWFCLFVCLLLCFFFLSPRLFSHRRSYKIFENNY